MYRGPFVYRKGSGSSSLTAALPSCLTLRDSYTGKEDQNPDFGTSYTDFGARQYSPAIRRWMTPDPLSEKYYGVSPYAFCNDNPVNFVDPDGEAWETFWDLASLGAGVKSLTESIKAGNVGDAILDGIGVVADAAAVLAPCIPGGLGASIAAARTLRKAPDANGGIARPHGNADHDASITEKYNSIKDVANDIRKNQIQVDVHGNVVGNNRPDLQYNVDGINYNFEVDRSEVNSERHRSLILNNDPYSVFEKRIIK